MSVYPNLTSTDPSNQTRKDFATDQDVRWCPGCGDYAILAAVQRTLPSLGIPKEKFTFISGIGCSSRFPYYMNTYGMHTIHGRAPALATGVKCQNPELNVFVITGDGDSLSIGGNHFMHVLRRNVDLTIILFNNRIYGLTKGQYSPTSEQGKKTKSTPMGSIDHPFNPISVALGAEAGFVARAIDVDAKGLAVILARAARHKGTSLVEVFQNCNIFNDGAFHFISDRKERPKQALPLEHGKPMIFGENKEKGIALNTSMQPMVVDVESHGIENVLVHDETNPAMAYLLSRLTYPEFPTPTGVFRAVDRASYDEQLHAQIKQAISTKGRGKVQDLIEESHVWDVS
jgi:2-oxoglutarate ferredoxin oxidoreductase subunit beta